MPCFDFVWPGLVRGILVYCAEYHCSHSIALDGNARPDHVRLSDLEPRFVCAGDLKTLCDSDQPVKADLHKRDLSETCQDSGPELCRFLLPWEFTGGGSGCPHESGSSPGLLWLGLVKRALRARRCSVFLKPLAPSLRVSSVWLGKTPFDPLRVTDGASYSGFSRRHWRYIRAYSGCSLCQWRL